ncbi:MAG: DsbA family protein [Bradymonadia bacterium]
MLLTALIGTGLLVSSAAAQGPALPGVDLKDMEADEITALAALLSEGACPCNAKLSITECVQQKSCERATNLATYGADKFREGFSTEEVREAVVKKYLDDNVTFTFDFKGSYKKGADNGRVVIVEYADFECPFCGIMSRVLSDIVKAHPKDVTVYFKHFPLPMHPYGEKASKAAVAAGLQGQFWPMHDLIFEHQGMLNDQKFVELAGKLGLNAERFKVDMASPAVAQIIERDRNEGIKNQLTGTPTIYINGKLYHEDKAPDAFKKHVEGLLKRSTK